MIVKPLNFSVSAGWDAGVAVGAGVATIFFGRGAVSVFFVSDGGPSARSTVLVMVLIGARGFGRPMPAMPPAALFGSYKRAHTHMCSSAHRGRQPPVFRAPPRAAVVNHAGRWRSQLTAPCRARTGMLAVHIDKQE